jgi:hypothetical protein
LPPVASHINPYWDPIHMMFCKIKVFATSELSGHETNLSTFALIYRPLSSCSNKMGVFDEDVANAVVSR